MVVEIFSLLGILGALTIEDIRRKQISAVMLALSGILGIVMHLYFSRISIWNLLGGIGVGLFMYLISMISKEQIGKGDALLITVTGIYLGFWGNMILLWLATMLAGLGGITAIIFLKKQKSFEIPFIPFVFAGYVVCLVLWEGKLL